MSNDAPLKDENIPESPNKADTDETLYECNICLDTASQPVISLCGHLFCWPCIHTWMISNVPLCRTCPVCKSAIEKDKLIPIYTRGKTVDPRDTIPERPHGQRTEPPNNGFNDMFQGFQFTTGTTVLHFGAFGLVPLFLQLAFNSRILNAQNNGINPSTGTRGFLSRLFLMVGILLVIVLVLTV